MKSRTEKEKYEKFIERLNHFKSERLIKILHRGFSKEFGFDKFNLHPKYHNLNDFAKLLFYYGVKSHILNYLFYKEKPVFIGYFQNINSDIELTKLKAIASQNKIAILIYNNPKYTQKTTVHNLLLTKGFDFYTKEKYIIYFKD